MTNSYVLGKCLWFIFNESKIKNLYSIAPPPLQALENKTHLRHG